jgi:hypothetical protein
MKGAYKMAHMVTCQYCKAKFDRDKHEFVLVGKKRYAHASCALRKAQEEGQTEKLEIIDPTDNVVCIYCKKAMSKKDADCVMITNGKYAHQACKHLEDTREKTDQEKLELYIQKIFGTSFISPRIKKQINTYVAEYGYTYSGIQKTLHYYLNVKKGNFDIAYESIAIVPYVYNDALNYYLALWVANQNNQNKDIKKPEVKVVKAYKPEARIKKRKLFTFLDEEEN